MTDEFIVYKKSTLAGGRITFRGCDENMVQLEIHLPCEETHQDFGEFLQREWRLKQQMLRELSPNWEGTNTQ